MVLLYTVGKSARNVDAVEMRDLLGSAFNQLLSCVTMVAVRQIGSAALASKVNFLVIPFIGS